MKIKSFIKTFISLNLLLPCLANAQDLPNPPPNIVSIAAGSYIIPMDNEHQSIAQNFGSDIFNVEAYGLVYELLENDIPIKWAIRAGKSKDEIDFTASARQIVPNMGDFAIESFRASAFIVDVNDLTTLDCSGTNSVPLDVVDDIIENANFDEVTVYELEIETEIDIRYTLDTPPVIGVLIDGTVDAHQPLLDDANIPYTELSVSDFIQDNACYSYISQSHINPNSVTQQYADGVVSFVENGGNFFAQCVAVFSYEDITLMMTTNSIEYSGATPSNNHIYLNNDMPIMQFEGANEFDEGSLTEFFLDNNSEWRPTSYEAIQTDNNTEIVRGADLNGATLGGNIFYGGGHDYSANFGFGINASKINTQRIYLNSVFIPSYTIYACAGNNACICEGESIQLGCGNESETGFLWSPADGLSCTACASPIATPSETTIYTVVNLSENCTSSSVTITILPQSPTIENLVTECLGNGTYIVSFDIVGGNSSQYEVTGNDGTLTESSFVSEPIAENTPYNFSAFDDEACPYEVTGIIDCSVACNATALLAGGGDICEGSDETAEISITLTGESPWTITYEIDNIAQNEIVATVSPYILNTQIAGNYSLTNIVDDASCVATLSGTALVNVETPPYSGENVALAVCITDDAFVLLDSMTNADENGVFSLVSGTEQGFPLDETTTLFNPNEQMEGTLVYEYEVTGIFCESEQSEISIEIADCEEEIEEEEEEEEEEENNNDDDDENASENEDGLLIPNAFSPNDDGVNDIFRVVGVEIAKVHIKIYNRWGQLVYDFETTDLSKGWNGIFKGEEVEIGVFAYVIDVTKLEGTTKQYAGNVTVIR